VVLSVCVSHGLVDIQSFGRIVQDWAAIARDDVVGMSPPCQRERTFLVDTAAPSFDAATNTRVRGAAAPLAAWVKANIKYSVVLEKIQPLEAELEEAESALERCTERLKTCEDEIAGIDKKVALLKDEFSARTREAEVLRAGLEKAQLTLEKAEGLLGKLSGEQTRWVETKKTLRDQLKALPQQMLLAAAFMTYLAKTPEDARESATREWIDIVDDARACAGFDFTRLLSTESQLLSWKQAGLPADPLSRENAIAIVHSTSRVPFIIDPANAAGSWLKAHLSETPSRPFESIQSHDARFVNQVELAVRFGKTLLIFDVDGLEPMLYPLARKDLQNAGPRKIVALGDKQLDFNENFRMLLVTRNPSPDLPPDAAALICEVNFTVTRSGLEGQLLGITIQHEQPELESKKSEMLKQEEDFKIELAALEKKLLEALATSEGDILENTSLIESLTQTKVTSKEIADALEKSSVASLELDQQREVYRPFARDGSTLFFLVSALIAVNSMYQFSLASFVRLFNATLGDAATQAAELTERLGHLTPALEKRVLYFVGRGLFKADRHMFAMHLVHGMHANHFRAKEWEYFTGELPKALDGGRGAQLPSWASADRAGAFAQLNEHFGPLVQMLDLANSNKWSRWAQSLECERDFPSVRELTPFQRVMVTQTLRPDRLLSMMQLFACEALGVGTLSPPPVSMAQLYEEAEAAVPTLLITTAGADPSKELEEFATEKVGREM
jgi:dynein heavy chain 2